MSMNDFVRSRLEHLASVKSGAPKRLPDDLIDVIAAVSSYVICTVSSFQEHDFKRDEMFNKLLMAVMRDLWQAGYVAGRNSRDLIPTGGRG